MQLLRCHSRVRLPSGLFLVLWDPRRAFRDSYENCEPTAAWENTPAPGAGHFRGQLLVNTQGGSRKELAQLNQKLVVLAPWDAAGLLGSCSAGRELPAAERAVAGRCQERERMNIRGVGIERGGVSCFTVIEAPYPTASAPGAQRWRLAWCQPASASAVSWMISVGRQAPRKFARA